MAAIGDTVLVQVTATRVRPAIVVDIRDVPTDAVDLLLFNDGTQDGLAWDAPPFERQYWIVNDETEPHAVGSWFAKPSAPAPTAPTEAPAPTAPTEAPTP